MDFEQYVINTLNEIKVAQEKTLIQTTKTNGRVNALEDWKENAQSEITQLTADANKIKGRDKVLLFVAVAAGTILGFIIQDFVTKHF